DDSGAEGEGGLEEDVGQPQADEEGPGHVGDRFDAQRAVVVRTRPEDREDDDERGVEGQRPEAADVRRVQVAHLPILPAVATPGVAGWSREWREGGKSCDEDWVLPPRAWSPGWARCCCSAGAGRRRRPPTPRHR